MIQARRRGPSGSAVKPRSILLAITVPVVWGLGITFTKAALSDFPPVLLMAIRFAVTALLLVWFVRPPVAILGKLFWIALISATIQYSLTFYGLKGLDASTAVLVLQLEAPFAVLLAVIFLKERLTLRRILGMLIAFAGVALIAGEPRLQGAYVSFLLVIAGAFTWSIGQVMIRALGIQSGMTLIAWVAVLATPQLFIVAFIIEDVSWALIAGAGWVVWATIAYLGVIMTALGYGIWYHLLGRVPVNQVAPYLLLLPVVTVASGMVLLGETLTPLIAVGGLVVIAGVAVIVIERNPFAPGPAKQEAD